MIINYYTEVVNMADAKNGKYYIGLDIGTDSVGYAVTDEYYMPLKKGGEPLLGVTTFEAASGAEERRAFRTARRRLDRKQQRVSLMNEIFAAEISKKDPRFFIRRAESALFREETEDEFPVFCDKNFTDKEYYAKYPTIHHLICDLMMSNEEHDVRLVYLACAWLVAHRGHFLFDVPAENIEKLLDFSSVYTDFCAFFAESGYTMPWSEDVQAEDILFILKQNTGVTKKKELFKEKIFRGKKPAKEPDEGFPFSREAIVTLLSGGKIKPEDIFRTGEYTEVESVSLKSPDEDFARVLSELGDDGELLRVMRAVQDCALLIVAQNGKKTISEAKVETYNQHKRDLASLKKFIRTYLPEKYNEIFRNESEENYVAYSYHVKSCKDAGLVKAKAGKDKFSDYLKKLVKDLTVKDEDKEFYEDMLLRLDTRTFLPKQKDTDNRVVPQQLYRYELEMILKQAERYLPMLLRKDENGLTAEKKILSIFDFRIPYFVGPLNRQSSHAWIERKADGKIYPWNFSEKVDLDKSEEVFIRRMTNTCTYVAGEAVLPVRSLLYCRFTVLNEINNLKVDGNVIPVSVKQDIYNELMMKYPRVSLAKIKEYLVCHGLAEKNCELSGADSRLTSSLSSYHQFRRLLESKIISENDAEKIIERAAYSEDKTRFSAWVKNNYPQISDADIRYLTKLNLKEFGRLSKAFLTEVYGCDKETGEACTIIEALWQTNNNLMQLLSDRFTFREELERCNRAYYAEHPASLEKRLDEMYISNAVRRPILRTLDICNDIVKSLGHQPEKIFVEMARDASGDRRGQRTQTRKQQLAELYKKIKTADARELEKELAAMGEMADNRLQSDKLFLYYLQMGKCAYSGQPIDLARIAEGIYNIDHIYPQAYVKDDSVLNNKVLVLSSINGEKKDAYPVPEKIRNTMRPVWESWKNAGLLTEEKYKRLTRQTPFTNEEKLGFINRQLVETRQSTKAVAQLLSERYSESSIVYVKAGLVSEFRQEFDMLKSRQVNNLHHAKDAYLNIVVGNVYDSRFSRQWFRPDESYSINTKAIFRHAVKCGGKIVWQGETDLAKVRAVMRKNSIHVSRYAFCRKGGLFDQMPLKAAPGLVPLKKGLPSEKYGGYNKPTASFFYLVKFTTEKSTDIMFMPVELLCADKCLADREYACSYAQKTVAAITGKPVLSAEILLDMRPIKINTMLEIDGLRIFITGKANSGRIILVSLNSQLILNTKQEKYIKKLEAFAEKRKTNAALLPDAAHDHITNESNIELYNILKKKLYEKPFNACPGNIGKTLQDGETEFCSLNIEKQVESLINILSWFGNTSGGIDTVSIGGVKNGGAKHPASMLSSWAKKYNTVYIVDQSPAGIHEKRSVNLLSLL